MKILALILTLTLAACGTRNERYTYLVAPEVNDEQLSTLRARDARMRVFMSADGSKRYLTSPAPVSDLGAQVSPLRKGSQGLPPAADEVAVGLIEGIINGLVR